MPKKYYEKFMNSGCYYSYDLLTEKPITLATFGQ